MSSPSSVASKPTAAPPAWLGALFGGKLPPEGGELMVGGTPYVRSDGVLRARGLLLSPAQGNTERSFSYLWSGRDRFQSDGHLATLGEWYRSMYGDADAAPWWREYGEWPLLVDAGCGAGLSALALFGDRLHRTRYLGVDISTSVDAAAERFAAKGIAAGVVQASLMELPLPDGSVDVIFSQGVLHHTDSTRGAILALAPKLRPGGRLLFYVYRRKGPIREFTDDYIRARLQDLSPDAAWQALMPLTRLGRALGELRVEIEVPEAIELLGIPAGRIDLQRLLYWHFCKMFHHPDWGIDELNHVNLDWYLPANAHRQTPEEVRGWCAEAQLVIEHEHLQESGITVIARRSDA